MVMLPPCGCDEIPRDFPCDMEPANPPETGDFLLPICTDKAGYQDLLDALEIARGCLDPNDCRLITIENALGILADGAQFIDDPTKSPCVDVTERCYEFPPSAAFIEYHPQNPYTEPDLIPSGYLFPPFYVADTAAQITYDAQIGAVITSLERLPPSSTDFPRIRVNLFGAGRAEFHMSALNTGGLLIIQVDDDLAQTDIVDLHQDIIGVPPETENIIVIEREFETGGAHHVDLTFIPTVQDAIPPVLFGGGLYKVVLCGFDEVPAEMPTILRQNDENPCLMEFSIDNGVTWGTAFDYSLCTTDCATDASAAIAQYQQFNATANQQQAILAGAYTGTPSSVNPDAPDDVFGDSDIPARDRSLCSASTAFVRWYAQRKAQQILLIVTATPTIASFAAILLPGLTWALDAIASLILGSNVVFEDVSVIDSIGAMNDAEAVDAVACCLYNALTDVAVGEVAFGAALDDCDFDEGSNEWIIAGFLAGDLAGNYLTFLDLLGDAKATYDNGQPLFCLCECPETEVLRFVGHPVPPEVDYNTDGGAFDGTSHVLNAPYELTVTLPEPRKIIIVDVFSGGFPNTYGAFVTINDTDYPFVEPIPLPSGGYHHVLQLPTPTITDTVLIKFQSVQRIFWTDLTVCIEPEFDCEDCGSYTEESISAGVGIDGRVTSDSPLSGTSTYHTAVSPAWLQVDDVERCVNRIGVGLSANNNFGDEDISVTVNGVTYPFTVTLPLTPIATVNRQVLYVDIPPQPVTTIRWNFNNHQYRIHSLRVFSGCEGDL